MSLKQITSKSFGELSLFMVIAFAFVFSMSGCGGGGGGGDGSSSNPAENVTISGKIDDGTANSPIRNAACRFVDQNGAQRATTTANANGEYSIVVPTNVDGNIICRPSGLQNLGLFTFSSTLGKAAGDKITGEDITPITTFVAQIIQSEHPADPSSRKTELLTIIATSQDPYLNLLAELATKLYAEMYSNTVNVNFANAAEFGGGDGGGNGGGDGGGVGGPAGDGGSFSPIANATCEFVIGNNLGEGRNVLLNAALADLCSNGKVQRPDLDAIKAAINAAFAGREDQIINAFKSVFPTGFGLPYQTTTDENGYYFLPVPPNVQGYVRCMPPGQEKLVLATFVPGRAVGETLSGQDVNPATTVFSTQIASMLGGDLNTTKKNYMDDIAGLDVQILQSDGIVSGFRLRPGTEPANANVGLMAFSATSLFDILYKNGNNVDYLAALDDLTKKATVDSDFLIQLSVPPDQATAYQDIVNDSVGRTETDLNSNLEDALSTATIRVTVTDPTGPVAGAEVSIEDPGVGIQCDNCSQFTDEKGRATLNLSGVPLTATNIIVKVSNVAQQTRIVALATVDLGIALERSYPLTVQISGNGTGFMTSSPDGIDCGTHADESIGALCTADFISGTPVTLTASPIWNSTFAGWSGDCNSSNPTCTVTMDQAHTVTAAFSQVQPPSPPTLIAPADGAELDNNCQDHSESINWSFSWSAVSDATQYELYVIGPNTTTPLIDTTTTSQSYNFSYTGDIADSNRFGWTWRVRAGNDSNGWSTWSERSFDVEPLDTDCPSYELTISDIGQTLIELNTGSCYDYSGAEPYPGSVFGISFNYDDPGGEVIVDDGAKVYVPFDDTPWSTFTGDGFTGSVEARVCFNFGSDESRTFTVRLVDAAGNSSNSLSITIPKPEGAN